MKAEDFSLAKIADHAAAPGTVERVSGIEQQLQSVAFRDVLKRFNVARLAPEMNGDNSGSTRGNQLLDASRIDTVSERIDIAKDGREAHPLNGVRCSNKSKGRNN